MNLIPRGLAMLVAKFEIALNTETVNYEVNREVVEEENESEDSNDLFEINTSKVGESSGEVKGFSFRTNADFKGIDPNWNDGWTQESFGAEQIGHHQIHGTSDRTRKSKSASRAERQSRGHRQNHKSKSPKHETNINDGHAFKSCGCTIL